MMGQMGRRLLEQQCLHIGHTAPHLGTVEAEGGAHRGEKLILPPLR